MLKSRTIQLQIAICDDEPIDRQQAADPICEIMGLFCDRSPYENGAAAEKLH